MPSDEEEDTTVYTVVINHEEQYSIWPKHKAIPQGWKAVGKEGPRSSMTSKVCPEVSTRVPLGICHLMRQLT
jgi:MbtH protein